MVPRRILPFIVPLLLNIGTSCNNAPQKPKNEPAEARSTMPSVKEPAKPAETPKPGRLDTARSSDHLSGIKTPASKAGGKYPAAPEASRSTALWPSGYITRGNAVLMSDPAAKASKISTLKQYEVVFILETVMRDEQGRPTNLPTWYKIERKDKTRGWVVASAINAGGGG